MKKLEPLEVEKPWGGFRQFVLNEVCTVKILRVKAGEEFSLQKHHDRDEFWRVISGNPDITVGETATRAKKGDEFEVQQGEQHRISAPIDDVEVLEIARGEFDEGDIIRLEDKYGRT